MPIHASMVLAQALRREGVDTMFYIMGGPMMAAELSVMEQGIRAIDVRHEQAAAMMAHAYARLRNRPGVCMAASGPGTLNLTTGLATSLTDCTPVVALGGTSPLGEWGTGAFQEFDQLAAMRPVVKWAERVYEARRIPELVRKAFRIATSGKPGPVYLDFPGDLMYQRVDEDQIVWPEDAAHARFSRPAGDPAAVDQLLAWIGESRKPVVLSGSGVIWSEASEALQRFVEASGIPFYTTPQGRGVVPEDHAYCYPNARNVAFREADLVIVVGTRVNYVVSYLKPPRFNAAARIARIELDPQELATSPRLDLGLAGDACRVLEQLVEQGHGRLQPERYLDWRSQLAQENHKRAGSQAKFLDTETAPIHPLRLCREIRDFMRRDGVLVVDGQEILNFGRQSIPSFYPGRRLNSGTFGTMGVGLPYALGAKVARPDLEVICLHGDGSFGLNAMEIDTAVRHRIPVLTVISLNGGWTADPRREKPGRDLGYTRFDTMSAALGAHGEWVERPEDIRPALERARAATLRGVPAVVNVKTDANAQATTAKFTTFYDAA